MNQTTAKYLIVIGLAAVAIGVMMYFFSDKFQWLGKLPGDIRYEGKGMKVFFPITTMVIISLIINVAVYLLRKFFN